LPSQQLSSHSPLHCDPNHRHRHQQRLCLPLGLRLQWRRSRRPVHPLPSLHPRAPKKRHPRRLPRSTPASHAAERRAAQAAARAQVAGRKARVAEAALHPPRPRRAGTAVALQPTCPAICVAQPRVAEISRANSHGALVDSIGGMLKRAANFALDSTWTSLTGQQPHQQRCYLFCRPSSAKARSEARRCCGIIHP